MINEKMGVPDNITEIGDEIYSRFMTDIKKILEENIQSIKGDRESVFEMGEMNFTINNDEDFNIKLYLYLIHFENSDRTAVVLSTHAGNKSTVGLYDDNSDNKKLFIKHKNGDEIIGVKIGVNYDWLRTAPINDICDEVIDVITKDIPPSTFSHELMHLYDNRKNDKIKIDDKIFYKMVDTISGYGADVGSFLYNIYFSTVIENVVRPSEIYHRLKTNKIRKSTFREYMKSDNIIKTIDEIINFDIENDLLKKIDNEPDAKNFVDRAISDGYKPISNRFSIDFLNLMFMELFHHTGNLIDDIIQNYLYPNVSPMAKLLGILPKKSDEEYEIANQNYKRIINQYTRFRDKPIEFIEYLSKGMKRRAEKTKRKLYKLYDMVDENLNNKKFIHTSINKFKKWERD